MTIIGISGSQTADRDPGFEACPLATVNNNYVQSVQRAGGLPLILPVLEDCDVEAAAKLYIEQIDGLILSGGHDLNPLDYGQEPLEKLQEIWPERDRFDRALLEAALAAEKPILGICRGFQLINAYFGASYLQDLSYSPKPLLKHVQDALPWHLTHSVEYRESSFFAAIFGTKSLVNSFHHLVFFEPGSGLEAVGYSPDGVLEAVEDLSRGIVACQFHPEMCWRHHDSMLEIFRRFIAIAAEARG
ncbi:MAG: gamma-glutamyl-gamma-aminobutyrate hydrolase family protein [Eubacteriales bacterium]|nr:gamma-glutamyl-gamma-aminobutyrate hydrolase family protein [Eubacteriales bacterium]